MAKFLRGPGLLFFNSSFLWRFCGPSPCSASASRRLASPSSRERPHGAQFEEPAGGGAAAVFWGFYIGQNSTRAPRFFLLLFFIFSPFFLLLVFINRATHFGVTRFLTPHPFEGYLGGLEWWFGIEPLAFVEVERANQPAHQSKPPIRGMLILSGSPFRL